jgi:CheY-like chemotaxis protein
VRVSLKLSPSTVELIVADCGYGMSEDFIRHNIYLPFAQQNPVASGIGLGLSLVKRNVDSLGGTVNIETDQASGTTATISVQTRDLVMGIDTKSLTDDIVPMGIVPSLPKRSKDDLPIMHACFYAPSTWIHRYDKRDERSIDLVFDSLSSTLGEWYQPVLSLWQRQKKRTIPDLIFISQRNLAEFEEECGDEFANVKKVVICAAIGKNSSQDRERLRRASHVADALITGAVLPSKLWEVVTNYFPHLLQPDESAGGQSHEVQSAEDSTSWNPKQVLDERQTECDSSSRERSREPDVDKTQSAHIDHSEQVQTDESSKQVTAIGSNDDEKWNNDKEANEPADHVNPTQRLLRTLSVPALDPNRDVLRRTMTVPMLPSSAQPNMLLVDDNNINLKMLEMFVNKCAIPTEQSTCVTGGREAIEVYKAFKGKDSAGKGFDIILMDLSMPEVSGFDATSSIRQIEKDSENHHRSYIVALTGLVSDKDRSAAYEAGVDYYATKPAGLRKVRDIIETWQSKRVDPVD